MNTLYFDIETVPTETAIIKARREAMEREQSHDIVLDEAMIKTLSLSALTAHILCIGCALNDREPMVFNGTEAHVLDDFWNMARMANLFVGYNILDFDLRFIWQRSIINQTPPSRDIPFIRFRQAPVFDCMHEWSKWGRDNPSLNKLCVALDITSPKTDLDGSKVFTYYQQGRLDEIYDYCKNDVAAVRQVYKRIIFK